MNDNNFPQSVRSCLWSYDIDKMDVRNDKDIIIFQVLNYGTTEAVGWLFSAYSRPEILDAFVKTIASSWFKRSLVFWETVFGQSPVRKTRFA